MLNKFVKTFKIFDKIEESNKKLWDYLKALDNLCSYCCKDK